MSRQPGIQILVQIYGDELDAELLDDITRLLQAEISELPVENVAPLSEGSIPAGAKAASGVRAGTLTITLEPTVITPLFEQLKSWTARQTTNPVKLRLQVPDRFDYDPGTIRPEQISALVKELEKTLSEK